MGRMASILTLVLCSLLLCTIFFDTSEETSPGPLMGPDGPIDDLLPIHRSSRSPVSGYVVVTTVGSSDPYYEVAQTIADHRGGTILKFDPSDLPSLMDALKTLDARYVAVVVRPLEMDINLNRAFIMNSTTLDDDPFTDFSWGYITGPTPEAAMDFVQNIIKAETENVQDLPLDIAGYSVTVFNFRMTATNSFTQYVSDSYIDLYLEENDTGSGRDFFLSNSNDLEGCKLIDISGNGDPHMTWLFEGGNFDPVPPVWPYDPLKIEDPLYARVGITPENLSGIDLYPAVMFSGTCHSGVPARALIEGDIAATFGHTSNTVRFYNMSEDFSFFNRIIKNNVTGYFAPIGANHGYNSIFDQWNALRYHEPLGDIQKRSLDQVVMGFMGNRPNLRLYNEGESTHLSDILPSGDFDPGDWPSAESMLGGKANRVYYGDPYYDPLKNDHDPNLNLTTVNYEYVNGTTLDLEISYHRPASTDVWLPNWDMYHHGEGLFYEAIDLPEDYSEPLSVSVIKEDPSLEMFHVLERFDGSTRVHVEADLASVDYDEETWYNITMRITRAPVQSPIHNLTIMSGNLEGHAKPGENATYVFSIKNTGNVIDNISISKMDRPDGWSLNIDFNGTEMGPSTLREARIKVRPPAIAHRGTKGIIALTFSSIGDPSIKRTINLTTLVDEVFGVAIVGGDRSVLVTPPGTVSVPVMIVNTGNGPDDIVLNISDHGEWSVQASFNGSNVPAGSTRTVTITIEAPVSVRSDENITFVLQVSSDGAPIKIDSIQIRADIIALYGISLMTDDIQTSVAPGEDLSFPIIVRNTGNVQDGLDLNISNDKDWPFTFGSNETMVRPGGYWNMVLNLTVPPMSLEGELCIFNVTISSKGNSSKREALTLELRILSIIDFEIVPPSNASGLPGTTLNLTVVVIHKGNGAEDLLIEIDSINDWTVVGPSSLSLLPWEEDEVSFNITVPKKITAGTKDTISIKATSGRTVTIYRTVEFNVTVDRSYGLSLTVGPSSFKTHRHKIERVEVIITNTGNGLSEIDISLVAPVGISHSFSQDSITIGPYSVGNLTLEIDPGGVQPGEYNITILVTDGHVNDTFNVQMTVLKYATDEDPPYVVFAMVAFVVLVMLGLVIFLVLVRSRKKEEEYEDWGGDTASSRGSEDDIDGDDPDSGSWGEGAE